jgi:hypothetical protein
VRGRGGERLPPGAAKIRHASSSPLSPWSGAEPSGERRPVGRSRPACRQSRLSFWPAQGNGIRLARSWRQHTCVGCRLVCSVRGMGVVGVSTERRGSAEFLPLLSRGKHRRPRSGACVMEYASFLAGEKWSDHPACTHPLLGELARHVNDFISDEARQGLVELVPDMIGLTGADLRIDLRIRAATGADGVARRGRGATADDGCRRADL